MIRRTSSYWVCLRTLRTAENAAWTRRWLYGHIRRETPSGTPLAVLLLTSGAIE